MYVPAVKEISGPYRFFFVSFDCIEPEHVHVTRDNAECKFWLTPVALAWGDGFSSRELTFIRRIVEAKIELILGAWNEHCN